MNKLRVVPNPRKQIVNFIYGFVVESDFFGEEDKRVLIIDETPFCLITTFGNPGSIAFDLYPVSGESVPDDNFFRQAFLLALPHSFKKVGVRFPVRQVGGRIGFFDGEIHNVILDYFTVYRVKLSFFKMEHQRIHDNLHSSAFVEFRCRTAILRNHQNMLPGNDGKSPTFAESIAHA